MRKAIDIQPRSTMGDSNFYREIKLLPVYNSHVNELSNLLIRTLLIYKLSDYLLFDVSNAENI